MTDDAIRVPYRICLDALWFGNADAKAFCSNSRNTLTNYTQTASNPTALLVQMGEYTNNQAVITQSAGSFHFIAIWLCAAFGSMDAAYSKQVINGALFNRVCGQAADCFGDRTMSDQYYYYNQSVAMLSFAAITGQFPNVWADTIKAVDVKSEAPARASTLRSMSVSRAGVEFALPETIAGRRILFELFDTKGCRVVSQSFSAGSMAAGDGYFVPLRGRICANAYVVKISTQVTGVQSAPGFVNKIVWK